MKISSITIRNYRSIRELTVDLSDHSVLLGPNNCGKSNVLRAIEFALSAAKATPEDFFNLDSNTPIEIETRFRDLDAQERTTLRKYAGEGDTFRIKKVATAGAVAFHGHTRVPADTALHEDAVAGLSAEAFKLHPCFAVHVPKGGKTTKETKASALRAYLAANTDTIEWTEGYDAGGVLGPQTIAASSLPDVLFVPAMLDTTEELKTTTTSLFGRLLKRLFERHSAPGMHDGGRVSDMEDLLQQLGTIVNERDGTGPIPPLRDLEEQLDAVLGEWRTAVRLSVQVPALTDIITKGLSVRLFEDGQEIGAGRKGHGLQRALLFGLIRLIGNLGRGVHAASDETVPRAASRSTILLVEEPELYLHPHAQRRMARELRALSELVGCQVVLASHSTHFVDVPRVREIVLVRKPDAGGGTVARQCASDLFPSDGTAKGELRARKDSFDLAHWINPDRAEMFFGRKVVFVEGLTEKVALPYLAERWDIDLSDVSIIECGSKGNLVKYIGLAKAFGLSYVVVHDEDPLPEGGGGGGVPTFELNAEIASLVTGCTGEAWMLSPDIEGVLAIPRDRRKPLAALEHLRDVADLSLLGDMRAALVRIAGHEPPSGTARILAGSATPL